MCVDALNKIKDLIVLVTEPRWPQSPLMIPDLATLLMRSGLLSTFQSTFW